MLKERFNYPSHKLKKIIHLPLFLISLNDESGQAVFYPRYTPYITVRRLLYKICMAILYYYADKIKVKTVGEDDYYKHLLIATLSDEVTELMTELLTAHSSYSYAKEMLSNLKDICEKHNLNYKTIMRVLRR